jgi:aryl-alcohol dehydrogenase-like predicted oxidoreductase
VGPEARLNEEARIVIPKLPFGRTGHDSSRVIFGAAALGAMKQDRADQILELLLEYDIDHIDTAAAYGESELRVGAWMTRHRDRFFLATKTGERSYSGARASLERSRERLQVDRIDLIQLHNLVNEREWQAAFAPDGALAALCEARDAGHVRFIGVTGHGTTVARRHRESLARFAFDSVLLPYNFPMLAQPAYAADVDTLLAECRGRGVAVQTIKAIARRRWASDAPARRFSWYEPLRDPGAIRRAVHWVLARPGLFLNTTSDATLLPAILAAASAPIEAPSDAELRADVAREAMAPLFEVGGSDEIGVAAF